MEAKSINASSWAKRPDGTDPQRYKGLEKWRYRRWAWEFLRRNSAYITECNKVRNGSDAEKLAVADQFGLKKFKMYSDSYKGKAGYPQFSMGSISSWTNLDSDIAKDRRVSIRLAHGQVLVRFNLESAIQDIKALEKQLRLAKQRIEKRLSVYEQILNKKAALHKHSVSVFGRYIRLLDLISAGKQPQECAEHIYISRVEIGRKGKYLTPVIDKSIEKAEWFAVEGYRYLSVLKGVPKSKGIPLSF